MKKDNMNGSVDLLAKAMRKVFAEEVQDETKPVTKDIAGVETEVKNELSCDGERVG